MRRLPRKKLWRSLNRRLCAGLTLVAYLCAAFGLPLPAQDFRCEPGNCGCSADAPSGNQCCCSGAATAPVVEECSWCKPGCCSDAVPRDGSECPWCNASQGKDNSPSVICKQQSKSRSCCSQSGCEPVSPSGQQQNDTGFKWRWQPGISAMKCLGLSVLWITSGAVPVAESSSDCNLLLQPLSWLTPADLSSKMLNILPAVPPPR